MVGNKDLNIIGLIDFTEFKKGRKDSWRIREAAFCQLILLWDYAGQEVKSRIQSQFRATVIQKNPHIRRFLEREESSKIRLGDPIDESVDRVAARRVEDYSNALATHLMDLRKTEEDPD